MRRIKVIKDFITKRSFVLSPAKTGSTYLASATSTEGHGHSFFADRIYFYNDVKNAPLLSILNKTSFLTLLAIKNISDSISQKKSVVLIPLRENDARTNSLFKDLLIPIACRHYHSREYRKIHHSSKDKVLEFYKSKINRDGFKSWAQDHLLPFQTLNDIAHQKSPDKAYIKEFGTVSLICFHINNTLDPEILSKMAQFDIKVDPINAERNASGDLWYSEILK